MIQSPLRTVGSNTNNTIDKGESDHTQGFAHDQPISTSERLPMAQASRRFEDFARLDRLVELMPNWDSYGAVAPTLQAVNTAKSLLGLLYGLLESAVGDRIYPTLIAPLADGGVQIEWSARGRDFELQIGPSGSLGYLFTDNCYPYPTQIEKDEVNSREIVETLARTLFIDE